MKFNNHPEYILREAIEDNYFKQIVDQDQYDLIADHIVSYFKPRNWKSEHTKAFCPFDIAKIIGLIISMRENGCEADKISSILVHGLGVCGELVDRDWNNNQYDQFPTKINVVELQYIDGNKNAYHIRQSDRNQLPLVLVESPVVKIELIAKLTDHQTSFSSDECRVFLHQSLSRDFDPEKASNLTDSITKKCAALCSLILASDHFGTVLKEIPVPSKQNTDSSNSDSNLPARRKAYTKYVESFKPGQIGWDILRDLIGTYWSALDKETCDRLGKDFKLRNKIHNAAHLIVNGIENEDPLARMVFSVSAIESIVGSRKETVKTVAKRLAVLNSPDVDSRQHYEKEYKKLYNSRSRLVHGDTYNVESQVTNEWVKLASKTFRQFLVWARIREGYLEKNPTVRDRSETINYKQFIEELDICHVNKKIMPELH